MPYLSFKEGQPETCEAIAQVKGDGDYNEEILYVHHGMTPEGRTLENDNDGKHHIALPPGAMFVPIPNPKKEHRDIQYIAGASGSGKSQYAKMICENYKRLFPKRPIWLISKLNEDSTLDKMTTGRPKRVNIDTLVSTPISDLSELNDGADGCCVVCDDWDTLDADKLKAVQQLIDDIASMGRHQNITLLTIQHRITNYSKTRLLLNEATFFVVYPQATAQHPLKYLLSTQCGLEDSQVKHLKKLGRWVMLHSNFPQYLLGIDEARITTEWEVPKGKPRGRSGNVQRQREQEGEEEEED